jgi:hypothetical protein
LVIGLALVLAATLPALISIGAGTASSDLFPGARPATIQKVAIPWTSASDGTGTLTILDRSGGTAQFNGTLLQVGFKPSSTAAPTDQYDLALVNDVGVDVLGGVGANLSATLSLQETPKTEANGFPFILAGTLELRITNAGNAKSGTVYLFTR